MKILIFGNNCQKQWLPELALFLQRLSERRIVVEVESRFADYLEASNILPHGICRSDTPSPDADLLVSIGGDGTFLRGAEWIAGAGIPIMGINTGHLGYLAGFSFDRPEEIFEALGGHNTVTPRISLAVESGYLPDGFYPVALNEISVAKSETASMVTIRAYINGRYLAEYQSDGLLISTPTGSTAYNLSCGGPIVQPTLDCIILTPVAPHSLTLRPLVVSADSVLELQVSSRGARCNVGVDGRTFSIPSEGTILKICRADSIVNVVQRPDTYFPEILRDKLHWSCS